MRRRLPVVMALPLATAVLALVAGPAAADPSTMPTTPIPQPADPNGPPASGTNGPQPLGHAVGDAGTGLAVVRLLPNSAPTSTILPGYSEKLPKQSQAELGFGLASAQANSESYLAQERAVAQASPGGFAYQGNAPQSPGSLVQTALPDNPQPRSGGLTPPASPLDTLLKLGAVQGQVQARWSEKLGPCVGTISDASTSLLSASLLNAIPTLPSFTDVNKAFDPKQLTAQQNQALDLLSKLAGPLSSLGGALPVPGGTGTGSLVSVPNTLAARSVVRLVDLPGSKNKAVQSVSTFQVASIKLLANTPLEISLNVVSQPTLTAVSGGDAKTSKITYKAPIITVTQNGTPIGTLDDKHQTMDIPVAVPLPTLQDKLPPSLKKLPLIGNVADLLDPKQLSGLDPNKLKIDIGVLRLNIGELNQKSSSLPFGNKNGYQIGATARMLDLQLLPTSALALPNLPSALAQVSLGEQVTRAAAPEGGVVCGTSTVPVKNPTPQGSGPKHLAYTNAAYQAVPMFWTGTALLLIGVVLVAALPGRRPARATVRPTPGPKEPPLET